MRIIAHRANLDGPSPYENTIPAIEKALKLGLEVEVDVRYINGKLFLGHDQPQEELDFKFANKHRYNMWIHCKNFEAFDYLSTSMTDLNCFWHDRDEYTLTAWRWIWMEPALGRPYSKRTIMAIPELRGIKKQDVVGIGGVCTDYPLKWKDSNVK